jgi:hypothetical protein
MAEGLGRMHGTGAGKAVSPFGKASSSAASPFGPAASKSRSPSGPGNPFSGAGGQSLFSEMDARLSPTMQPDDFEEKPWWQTISLGQVVRIPSLATVPIFHCSMKLAALRYLASLTVASSEHL